MILQTARISSEEKEEETVLVVTVAVSNKTVAFLQEGIKEITRSSSLTPIPGMPESVVGLVNLRGEPEALLDFRSLVSISKEPPLQVFQILLGEMGELRAALYVDEVLDLLDVPKQDIIPPPSDLDENLKPLLVGEISYGDEKIPLFSFSHTLARLARRDS
ncbi:MAG: chemotaxis protein CheW [Armatimonadetes bacterium]|nr:chemotaxis protein CheW [Armatimonadota bacterium]